MHTLKIDGQCNMVNYNAGSTDSNTLCRNLHIFYLLHVFFSHSHNVSILWDLMIILSHFKTFLKILSPRYVTYMHMRGELSSLPHLNGQTAFACHTACSLLLAYTNFS